MNSHVEAMLSASAEVFCGLQKLQLAFFLAATASLQEWYRLASPSRARLAIESVEPSLFGGHQVIRAKF